LRNLYRTTGFALRQTHCEIYFDAVPRDGKVSYRWLAGVGGGNAVCDGRSGGLWCAAGKWEKKKVKSKTIGGALREKTGKALKEQVESR
jgi:hypothetical protein